MQKWCNAGKGRNFLVKVHALESLDAGFWALIQENRKCEVTQGEKNYGLLITEIPGRFMRFEGGTGEERLEIKKASFRSTKGAMSEGPAAHTKFQNSRNRA